ncbi:SGF29 tudor-like domain containing protein [Nitzschia inconspicua]|uniref:SGF29 tudor-like domain containing protein n=1 Tax=Nitzschia inconspicua TaxID=303405 RepID=A0A9K3PFP6_9STRA|nr:SGF29 tudor-like domain containing protein [Nitzschia inconspicua]
MAPANHSGDETYLEAFMDHISTVPAELRRNLDLMKDLDQTSSTLLQEMTQRQKAYVAQVEEKIVSNLEVIDGKGVVIVPKVDPTDREKDEGKKKKGKSKEASKTLTEPVVVIPTTEEFLRFVHDAEAMAKIRALQTDCLQQAEEKVAISQQTYAIVDNICRRLDSDLREMEKLLLTSGEFQTMSTGKPNDLAAIQAPGTADWILAKVISFDPATRMYNLSDEDVESSKVFNLPESEVIILGGLRSLRTGDVVYAVYPDTTSFYKGTVSQAPRKSAGGGSVVMISFMDDHDENGITYDKAVQMKHIMLPPS